MKSLAAIVAIAALVATAALAQGVPSPAPLPPASKQTPKHVPSPDALKIFDEAFNAVVYAAATDESTPGIIEYVLLSKDPCPIKELADKGWLLAALSPPDISKEKKAIGGCWSIKENMIAVLWMNKETDVFPMQGWEPMPKYKKEYDEAVKKQSEKKKIDPPHRHEPAHPVPNLLDPYHGGLVPAKG